MDAGHLRAWEHNDSPSHPLTSHIPNSNQGTQMPVTPINQTPISTTFLHHDRTLPSLSSVFENNSIRTASNHNPQPHDRSYPSEIKPSTTSDQGLKRPRLSHDQGRRSDSDIRSDSTRVTIPVSSPSKAIINVGYGLTATIFTLLTKLMPIRIEISVALDMTIILFKKVVN